MSARSCTGVFIPSYRITQPARRDYNHDVGLKLRALEKCEKSLPIKPWNEKFLHRLRAELAEYRDLESQLFCGVYYDGDLSVKMDGNHPVTFDWALIKVDASRLGTENLVRTVGHGDIYVDEVGSMELDLTLYKMGRRTGATSGLVNARKTDVKLGDIETTEWTIVSTTNKFSDPGDSGAWTASEGSAVHGYVIGGNEMEGCSYISDMRFTLSLIKDETGLDLTVYK